MLLTVISAILFTACASASAASAISLEDGVISDIEIADMEFADDVVEIADVPEFMSFNGVIAEVNPFYEITEEGEFAVEGKYFVLVKSGYSTLLADGEFEETYIGSVNFIIDQNTLLLLNAELEVGMSVTGFYETGLPITRIYPPQHQARALLSSEIAGFMFVDRFDADLKAFTQAKQLIINEDDTEDSYFPATEIIFEDGTPFDGDLSILENRALIVLSGPLPTPVPEVDYESVLNIIPEKIIILFERAVPPIHYFTDEELALLESGGEFIRPDDSWQGGLLLTQEDLDLMWDNMFDPETVQVFVEGEVVDMPTPFINREAGAVMVPVAYIAEALGFSVFGEGEDLMIGRGTTFTIGEDSYFYGRMAPVQLGAAPEIHDGVIFVPMHFFGNVLPAGAYVSYGNIYVTHQQEWEAPDWSLFNVIIDGAWGINADLYSLSVSEEADEVEELVGLDFPTHISLTQVAAALGVYHTFEFEMDDSDPPVAQSVSLEGLKGVISFTVGSEEFTVADETITLFNYQTSIIVDGEVFVPIIFFRDIFGMSNAFWSSGQIHLYTYGADDMH